MSKYITKGTTILSNDGKVVLECSSTEIAINLAYLLNYKYLNLEEVICTLTTKDK